MTIVNCAVIYDDPQSTQNKFYNRGISWRHYYGFVVTMLKVTQNKPLELAKELKITIIARLASPLETFE